MWLELTAPEPIQDELGQAQLPRLILEVLEEGWEAPAPAGAELPPEEHGGPGLLDVRVLTHPAGAVIGLAVDTEVLDIALTVGTSLGRHLAGSASALRGWVIEEVRAERRRAPEPSGDWLPSLDDGSPRFAVAQHLPDALQDLAARYLLAAAVRDLHDPTGRTGYTRDAVRADDLVAAAAIEDVWCMRIVRELGPLLVAAGRREARSGRRRPLTAHGGGDPDLAAALLDLVRAEIDRPATGHDEDGPRGGALLERFVDDHGLRYGPGGGDDLDPAVEERLGQQRWRTLLWAGLRVLTTLAADLTQHVRTPWLWLAELAGPEVDPVVGELAGRDGTRLTLSDWDDREQLRSAARAHVLVRAALLHPRLLDEAGSNGLDLLLSDADVVGGPLHQLVAHVLLSLDADVVADAPAADAALPDGAVAAIVAALRSIELDDVPHDADPFDDLYVAIANLLPGDDRLDAAVNGGVLKWLAAAAGEDAPVIARQLFTSPGEIACVMLSGFDVEDDDERRQRTYVLAEAAAVDPELVAGLAADSPALGSQDPRDEPAFRNEVDLWRRRLAEVVEHLDEARLPEPAAVLLRDFDDAAAMTTAEAAETTLRAVSVVSVATGDRDLPARVLR